MGVRQFALALLLSLTAMPALAGAGTGGDWPVAAQKIRTYCRACHGVGNLRFIYSDDDQELWTYLFTNRSPSTGKLWAEAITQVLGWPSDSAPPFEQLMDPSHNRDWMPKGVKRLQLAEDQVDGKPARKVIVDTLKGGLSRLSYPEP